MSFYYNPSPSEKRITRMWDKYGLWGQHPLYPLRDWKYAATNDDTRLGYWEWVEEQLEEE